MLARRSFLGAGMAGATALTFSSVWSQAAPNFGAPTLPTTGFKRMKIGALEVIAFNDGALRRPLGEEFVTNAPLEQVKALLASQNLPTDYVDIPFTPFVVVAGGRKVLFGLPAGGRDGLLRVAQGMAKLHFDPDAWLAFFGGHADRVPTEPVRLRIEQALLAVAPTQAVPEGSVGVAYLRALTLDPAYQLK